MDLIPLEERDELWAIEKMSGTYHRGLEDGRKEGLEQGLEQGREQGLEQGREQGAEAGRRAVLRDMIIALLEVRGLPMTETMQARVREESSLPILQGWARKAREISQADALFSVNEFQ